MGQKQKTERKKKRGKRRERLNDGDNNGQALHGARKHAWRTQAAWAKRKKKKLFTMASFASVRHHGWRTQLAWTNSIPGSWNARVIFQGWDYGWSRWQ